MINGDANIWTDQSVSHDLIITDGVVTISGNTYSISNQTVIIDNDILEAQEFTLTQRLSSKDQLQFGSCEANSIEFTVHENLTGLKGKVLKVYMIPNHDASKMVQLGVFKVEEDELSADRTKREVTAYDAMYDIINADVASWYNNFLPNTSTIKTMAQFRASFLAHFGLEVEPITLVNDSMTIKRTIEPEEYSGSKMLQMICEINGVFGTIDHQGKFKFVELSPGIEDGLFPMDILYPSDDLYPQDVNHDVTYVYKQHYTTIQFEDYISQAITGLKIRQDTEDVGTTIGTTDNLYIITGNALVFGKSSSEMRTIATNVLNKIKNRYYRPCVISAIGNPLHELGDPIRVSTMYRGITTYILERKLVGIQSLKDTYTARGQEKFEEELNSISNQFKQLSGKTLRIEADVDGVSVDLEDLDERESSHYTQTSGQIALKVSKGDVSSEISLEEGTVTLSGNRLIVNSTNFTLDEDGDATFSGTVTGATILGSTITTYGTIIRDPLTMKDGCLTSTSDDSDAVLKLEDAALYMLEGNKLVFISASGITLQGGATLSGTASHATLADTASSLSSSATVNAVQISGTLDSKGGLSANVDGDLIYIGNTWRATSKRYADNHYQAISSSDKRIKCDIIDVEDKFIDVLDKVQVKNFRYKNKDRNFDKLKHVGVIAQEVLTIMQDCGIDVKDQNIVEYREPHENEKGLDKVYVVNYEQLTTLLIPAYQKLKREHEELKREVEYMKTTMRQDREILKDILHEKGVI